MYSQRPAQTELSLQHHWVGQGFDADATVPSGKVEHLEVIGAVGWGFGVEARSFGVGEELWGGGGALGMMLTTNNKSNTAFPIL